MIVIKIRDIESGEIEEREECRTCDGMSGWDKSNDPEIYDDWQECLDCNGRGWVEPGYFDKDVFIPERDALTPND